MKEYKPHVEVNENDCVEYTLDTGNLGGAKSFKLVCS